jgi:hypothetical protein
MNSTALPASEPYRFQVSMRIPLSQRTAVETPSPRMFWVSFARTVYPVTFHPTMYNYLTASVGTDRVIRLSSPLGRAFDHRHSQIESGFCTDHHSCVDLQRDKRYRVHVCVSVAHETFLPFPSISLIPLKRQQG